MVFRYRFRTAKLQVVSMMNSTLALVVMWMTMSMPILLLDLVLACLLVIS